MAALDPLVGSSDLSGPARRTIDVDAEKHDTNELSYVIRAFRVTVGGTVKFTDHAGNDRTVTLAAGEVHDLCYVRRVWSTGTTATGILGYV